MCIDVERDQRHGVSPAPSDGHLDKAAMLSDSFVEKAQSHRQGETYPTLEQLLANLTVVLRALAD